MAMGFGCNAAGVVGCRIIDSPRERLLAILTNSFVPCNGRFPILIFLLGAFFSSRNPIVSALMLTGVVCLGIAATFGATRLLSATVLCGETSSYVLELPPWESERRSSERSLSARSLTGRYSSLGGPPPLPRPPVWFSGCWEIFPSEMSPCCGTCRT